MTPKFTRLIVCMLLFGLVATSASAAVYTVTLKNGTSFDTRYRPLKADWAPDMSMFMTDKGNYIAIPNDEIADVVSIFEEMGFGYQINTTTRVIGVTDNDLVDDDAEEGADARYDGEADQGGGGFDYSMDQFLNIPSGDPGAVGGGIPYGAGEEPQ